MEARDTGDALELCDPKRLIRQLMELNEPTPASARECIVLWLMSLADDVDPADAARRLLEALPDVANPRTSLAADMARELEEVARFPRQQLLASRRPRRAGRRRA
jgi:hypothetical protein